MNYSTGKMLRKTLAYLDGFNLYCGLVDSRHSYRVSKELRSVADRDFTIKKRTAAGHQFPEVVEYEENGRKFQVHRPASWK